MTHDATPALLSCVSRWPQVLGIIAGLGALAYDTQQQERRQRLWQERERTRSFASFNGAGSVAHGGVQSTVRGGARGSVGRVSERRGVSPRAGAVRVSRGSGAGARELDKALLLN